MIAITAATMMKEFPKNSFSGIPHVMRFYGIGFYLLFHLKNLDYPSTSHYTPDDEDLYLRAMHMFCGNRLKSDSRLVHTFMEMVTGKDGKAILVHMQKAVLVSLQTRQNYTLCHYI